MIIAGIYNYQEHEKWNSIPCGYKIKQFYTFHRILSLYSSRRFTNYLFCLRLKSGLLEHARENHSEHRSIIRQNMRATLRAVSWRVQSWGSWWGICGEQSGNEADFSEYFDFLQPIIIPSYTSIHLSLEGWAMSPSKATVSESHGNM